MTKVSEQLKWVWRALSKKDKNNHNLRSNKGHQSIEEAFCKINHLDLKWDQG